MSNDNKTNLHKTDERKKIVGFEFPCLFPIKIMAKPDKKIKNFIRNILEKNIDDPKLTFKTKESKMGKYISVTATFKAKNKTQLDEIYSLLTANKNIILVL